MSYDLIEAAVALADMLAQENKALTELDLPRAVALLEQKHQATEAFLAARSCVAASMSAEQCRIAEQTAERLNELTLQNRHLLERAMAVQSRVIGVLTRGVPGALTGAPRYTADGALARTQSMPPISLSSRA